MSGVGGAGRGSPHPTHLTVWLLHAERERMPRQRRSRRQPIRGYARKREGTKTRAHHPRTTRSASHHPPWQRGQETLQPMEPLVYRFGDAELDERRRQLTRRGRELALEPRVFDLLVYLLRHRDRVVSKSELLEKLWPGVFVSESVLPTNVTTLRKVLGDDRSRQRIIKTVYGRGYHFVAAVEMMGNTRAPPADCSIQPPADTDAERPTDASFIGRRDALATLGAAFERATTGTLQLVLLAGEPGIGKTRLAEEFASRARRAGARSIAGCSHEEAGGPYRLWVQVLRAVFRERDEADLHRVLGAEAEVLLQLVPELGPVFPERSVRRGRADERARMDLFDAVARTFWKASQAQPLLIFLDDLHWADESSLLLLRFLARELRETRILVLAAYRDIEVSRALSSLLAELVREPGTTRLPLRGLTSRDVSALVARLTSRAPSPQVAESLHTLTEGNPFFLGEIVRWLGDQEAFTGESLPVLQLPEGVREVIGRRLGGLSNECNDLLAVASVLGREFDFALLRRMAELDDPVLLDLLDEAASSRIVDVATGGFARFRFSHALLREVLYAERSLPWRVREHRRAGEMLEQLHPEDLTPHLSELAHHFFQAAIGSVAPKAIDYGRRAARRSIESLAFEEAAAQLERVLQALDLDTDTGSAERLALRCEVLLELGDAHARSGERGRGRDAYREVTVSARRLGRWDLFARAAVGFGMRSEHGAPTDASLRLLLEEAREQLRENAPALRSQVLARLSGTEPYASDPRQSVALASEAMELARRAGDLEAQVTALAARCWALDEHGPREDLIAAADELLAMAERLEREGTRLLAGEVRSRAHQARYNAHLRAGEMREADAELVELDRLAESLRQPTNSWIVSWHHLGQAIAQARFADAEHWLSVGRCLALSTQIPGARELSEMMRFFLLREQGIAQSLGDQPAPRAFADFLQRLLTAWLPYRWPLQCAAATLDLELGARAEARRRFEDLAQDDFRGLPRDSFRPLCLGLLSELCTSLGDRKRARILHQLLLPHEGTNLAGSALRLYLGSASHYLALLTATLECDEEARRHFEEALAMNERMGSVAHANRTRLAFGDFLLRQDNVAARRRGLDLLLHAASTAERLGMLGIAAQAKVRLSGMDTRSR